MPARADAGEMSGKRVSETRLMLRAPRLVIALIACAPLALVLAAQAPASAVARQSPVEVSATTTDRAAAKFERWATLTKTSYGYYYDAGQQNTHLTLTRVKGGVRYADRHTDVLRSKPRACHKKKARVGIVVICRVPASVSASNPMTLKVFTRLGNDYVNSSKLPAAFELNMLCDKGKDVIHAGAGDDFINGAQGRDRIRSGGGNDWVRTGLGNDVIRGGAGRDQLVGVYGSDKIYGGAGNDRVGGGPGNDLLFAGSGEDFVLCGPGRDIVHAQRSDRIFGDCESIRYG